MTRDKAIEFAEENDLPIDVVQEVPVLHRPERLWGRAVETGFLEDIWNAPDRGRLRLHRGPRAAARGRRGRHHLRPGRPGRASTASRSPSSRPSQQLNQRAGAQGVGRLDMVEDRLVGIKSREVYEAPGAIALITAHQELENVTVERDLARFKRARRPALGRAGLRRPVVLAAQAGPRRLHRRGQRARLRRHPDDPARRPGRGHRPAQRASRCTTSTSRPTTPATRSTSRWPRASSSCGACPARSRRGATSG